MATLNDVFKTLGVEKSSWILYGATPEWMQKVNQSGRKIRDTIIEEFGISMEQAASLPRETDLGPKAQAAYEELAAFIDGENRRIESSHQ